MGGYGYPDYARVSIGTPAENQRFVTVMEKVLRKTGDGRPKTEDGKHKT
jgi:histidinol-phosphate/aromatic aminotransferase/cobyric acid decarboxylase-like protein